MFGLHTKGYMLVRYRVTQIRVLFFQTRAFTTLDFQEHASRATSIKLHTLKPLPTCFSFSGAGWATAFHLGCAQALQDRGCMNAVAALPTTVDVSSAPHSKARDTFTPITNKTPRTFTAACPYIAGASGGALVAVAIASGILPSDALAMQVSMCRHVNRHGVWGKLGTEMHALLQAHLPANSYQLCSGRVGVFVTPVWPRASLQPVCIETFTSNDELIEAVLASCHIPFYLFSRASVPVRSIGQCIDGGLWSFLPRIDRACHVSAIPASVFGLSQSVAARFAYIDIRSVLS
jgi:hypothetical protein